jgi:hypothetical protein
VDVLETKVSLMEGGLERMPRTQQQMADNRYDIDGMIATRRGAWLAIAGIAGSVGAVHRGRRPRNRRRITIVGFPVGRRLAGPLARADACQKLYLGVRHAEPARAPFYVGAPALVVSHTGRSIPTRVTTSTFAIMTADPKLAAPRPCTMRYWPT